MLSDEQTHGYAVRTVHADEWRDLKLVRLRALREDAHAFGSTYGQEATRDNAFWIQRAADNAAGINSACFVAGPTGRDGSTDRFVGLAVGFADESIPDLAWLVSMWVAPEARGEGLGLELIDRVCGWAHSIGRTDIRLEVHADNTHARRLYDRAGFRQAEHIAGRPVPPCEIAMTKPATSSSMR